MPEAVQYRVSMPRPHSHLFEVEVRFPAVPGALEAVLPVWTPGSYLVREYARQLQDFAAWDARGNPLPFRRTNKRTFRVEANGNPTTLRYRAYANELSVRTSHLDGTHGYFNGASLFLYCESLRNQPHQVQVEAPQGWRVFTALPLEGGLHVARDYDELVDSPFEVGPHTPLTFKALGIPHDVVVWGDSVPNPEKLVEELRRICEAQASLFGGSPLARYLFIVHLTDKGRGGLEHQASTSLLFPRAALHSSRGWEDFLTLAAHEYFHLWNVKRIKPRAFVPVDYSQEMYTDLLWFFEGATSYYDNLFVRRAGLMSGARYLSRLGEAISSLHGTPGRKTLTLADASTLSWVKHYRPDENSPNSAVSYYLKGEVVCALLDLELRALTGNARSLDDVMRLLWTRFGDGSGVPEDGIERTVSEVAGRDLSEFFQRALRSTEELDYSKFAHVGLELRFRPRESTNDKGGSAPRVKAGEVKPRGWLGITVKGTGGIASVLDGSPAQEAGLYPEDELLALDGFRADGAAVLSRCEDKRPGEQVRISVFRRDRLLEVPVTLGSKPADGAYLMRTERPTDAQKAAFEAWLHGPWDEQAG